MPVIVTHVTRQLLVLGIIIFASRILRNPDTQGVVEETVSGSTVHLRLFKRLFSAGVRFLDWFSNGTMYFNSKKTKIRKPGRGTLNYLSF